MTKTELTPRLTNLTHGQLVTLVEKFHRSAVDEGFPGDYLIDSFLAAAEAAPCGPGSAFTRVQVALPDGQEDEQRVVSVAQLQHYQATGMTEWEAVQAAHDHRHGKHTGRLVHYDREDWCDENGEDLPEE